MCKGFGLFCGVNPRMHDRQFAPLDIAPIEDDCTRLRHGSRNDFAAKAGDPLPCPGHNGNGISIVPNSMSVTMRSADHLGNRSAHSRSLMDLNAEVNAVLGGFKVGA